MSRRSPKGNGVESRMVRAIDELANYEAYCEEILPALREAVRTGKKAEEIYAMAEAAAAARAVTIAVNEKDSSKSLAAIKEVLDRSKGKARERIDTTHRLAQLNDDQLDAMLKSKMVEVDSTSEEDE